MGESDTDQLAYLIDSPKYSRCNKNEANVGAGVPLHLAHIPLNFLPPIVKGRLLVPCLRLVVHRLTPQSGLQQETNTPK